MVSVTTAGPTNEATDPASSRGPSQFVRGLQPPIGAHGADWGAYSKHTEAGEAAAVEH